MDKRGGAASRLLFAAVLWGSLWGLAEASLGYLLHIVRVPGLPGLVMAPIGLLAMGRAFVRTGELAVFPATALAAASFKLAALLVPGINVLAVVNPVRAMLLESLVAALLARLSVRSRVRLAPSRAGLASPGKGTGGFR